MTIETGAMVKGALDNVRGMIWLVQIVGSIDVLMEIGLRCSVDLCIRQMHAMAKIKLFMR